MKPTKNPASISTQHNWKNTLLFCAALFILNVSAPVDLHSQNKFSQASFDSLVNSLKPLADSFAVTEEWFNPDEMEDTILYDSNSYFFQEGMLQLLQYPQSRTFDFAKFSGFFSHVIQSGDGKLKFICFSRGSGGTAGEIYFPFIQYRKKNGQPCSYFWLDLHQGSIYKLHPRKKDMYLVVYALKGNTSNGIYGASLIQIQGDSINIDYPAFHHKKSSIHLMCPYGDVLTFDKKNEIIHINLTDACELKEYFIESDIPDISNGYESSAFLKYDDSLRFKLKFDGKKFVQIKN